LLLRWPPSAAQTVRAVFPHPAFMNGGSCVQNVGTGGQFRGRPWRPSDLVVLPPSLNVRIHHLIAFRRKLLIEGFWGDFPRGGSEGHEQYARRRRTEIARCKPEVAADVKAVAEAIPIPRDEDWLGTESFFEISMGLSSVCFRGYVTFLNEGMSGITVRLRKEGNLFVLDPAWAKLVRDRIRVRNLRRKHKPFQRGPLRYLAFRIKSEPTTA